MTKPRVGGDAPKTPFAAAVQEIRFRLKWSQERLAEVLHVDRVTVARWEGGGGATARAMRDVAALADKHGIALPDGFGKDGAATPQLHSVAPQSAEVEAQATGVDQQLLQQIQQLPEERRVQLLVQLVRENALRGK
jgi:transcriptional regulator with XRE-family HTH domain